ncbi:hypothetical protein N5079_30500 [Planotetraspora sp. A-T 1434]|uniref:hypothetical protein n=1 Tax=Planotetraspora sp. A-T 1434 TaxID=2979219 RepID=UPI0021C0338D|nr:hypothetical protein [Planotetraspora sp. A-T 1434]MCT9934545.1 hypothetical protein [Planotetraspora sp. A-T 1434]
MTDQKLAAEFRELAGHPALAARSDQLIELADALNDPAKADLWCEVDLFAAFPPDDTVLVIVPYSPTWQKIAKFIHYIQAVLVFLPIATTWSGLKMATTAYGEALKDGGVETARRPFLEMWQQGFDGKLAGLWKFDNVAMMTLSTIGLLIVVTLLERYMHRWEDERASEQADELRPRLLSALTRATLSFGQVRLASPARFQAELTKSASELGKMGNTVRRVQKQVVEALEKALEVAHEAAGALVSSATDVQSSLQIMDKHLSAVNASAETLTQAVDRTAYAIDSVGEKTDQAVDRVGDQLGMAILDATQGVRVALDQVTTLTGQAVRDSVQSLDARVGELVGAASGIKAAVGGVDGAVGRTGEQITQAVTAASSTLTSAFGHTGSEVREALGDWADTAGAHAARVEMVSDTAGRTVQALEETRDVLDRLPLVLSKTLEEIPVTVHEIVSDELSRLSSAVSQLNATINGLATALTPGAGDTGAVNGAA